MIRALALCMYVNNRLKVIKVFCRKEKLSHFNCPEAKGFMIPSCRCHRTVPRKQPSRLVWKSWCFYCKYCISNSSKNRHQTACFTKQFQNNRSGSGGPCKSWHRYQNDAVHRRQLWFPLFHLLYNFSAATEHSWKFKHSLNHSLNCRINTKL